MNLGKHRSQPDSESKLWEFYDILLFVYKIELPALSLKSERHIRCCQKTKRATLKDLILVPGKIKLLL